MNLGDVTGNLMAIKFIRNLPVIIEEITVDEAGTRVQRIRTDIGLKEAKDFIEKVKTFEPALNNAILSDRQTINALRDEVQRLTREKEDADERYWNLRRRVADTIGA
jgi:hypothetical protein